MFSMVVAPVYIPRNSAQGLFFSMSLTRVAISWHFDNSQRMLFKTTETEYSLIN